MTSLRDYILDHGCPTCGHGKKQASQRRTWWDLLRMVLVVFAVVGAVVCSFQDDFAQGAFDMALATFLVVTDR